LEDTFGEVKKDTFPNGILQRYCGGSSGGGDSVGIGGYSYEAVCEQVYITHMR